MKLHALMIAAALAVGSTFALAANEGAGMGPNGASAASSGATATAGESTATPAKHMKKMSAKHHRRHYRQHARAERREREHMARAERREHEHMARAERREHEHMAMRNSTRSMGAGRYSPSVDLNAPSRERRMESAYNDWLRAQGRR